MAARCWPLIAILLIGAAPAPAARTVFIASDKAGTGWCAYRSKPPLERSRADEVARVTYRAGKVTRLTRQINPESGDWVLVDSYALSGGRVRIERRIGMAQGGIQVVKRGQALAGRKITLSLISATRPDGRKAEPDSWYDPDSTVTSNVESLPFVAIGRRLLRRNLPVLCRPGS